MTPEGKVKARIRKILKDMEAYYAMPVMTGYGNAGIPDFLVCYKGVFFGIEAKANNGTVTDLQRKNLENINEAGGAGFVVFPSDVEHLRRHMDEYVEDIIFRNQFKEIQKS